MLQAKIDAPTAVRTPTPFLKPEYSFFAVFNISNVFSAVCLLNMLSTTGFKTDVSGIRSGCPSILVSKTVLKPL